MKIPVKYIDTRKYIATLMYDDMPDDPSSWGNFTMELFGRDGNVDVEDYKDDNGELKKEYQKEVKSGKRFWLDKYEHGGVSYSLSGEGMQCQFDTSNQCGFIVFDDEYIKGVSYDKRKEYARGDINIYNEYVNGEVYTISLKTDTGLEIDDYCGGIYGSGVDDYIKDIIGSAEYEVNYV